jgi:ferritin-like metal-binding protein YciE
MGSAGAETGLTGHFLRFEPGTFAGLARQTGASAPPRTLRRYTMSAPEDLHDLYIGELQDLWSANDQMARVLKKLIPLATDEQLQSMLEESMNGIAEHTELLKELLDGHDEEIKKEHCKGMEGLAAEAIKHTTDEAPPKGPVLDAQIIAQYQRMTHYGIAGFGTATAFAEALGYDDDASRLDEATASIYDGDEYMTKLAESAVNADAEDAG